MVILLAPLLPRPHITHLPRRVFSSSPHLISSVARTRSFHLRVHYPQPPDTATRRVPSYITRNSYYPSFSRHVVTMPQTIQQEAPCPSHHDHRELLKPQEQIMSTHLIENTVRSSYFNQGTATPVSARYTLRIQGLIPPAIENIDIQKRRALVQLRSKSSPLEMYIFLAWLRNTNVRLFYRIVMDELEEVCPLIYTPTVGTACVNYSQIYPFLAPPGVPDGLFISLTDLPNIKQIIKNYKPFPSDPTLTPQIAVITDGSRILGLGDLGVNGMGIPVGKLQLYVAGAGVDPRRTLPITIDVGTNNEKNLNDEFYLGLRRKRVSDTEFFPFVDTVLKALNEVYPDMLIQFEDFSSEHAFQLLEKYQSRMFCFNDDIQGTGAVILSGFMNAIRLASIPPKEHRILFFGAGSAGVGVAKQLLDYFKIEHAMSEQEAKRMVWLVDSKGLVTFDRGDKLANHKTYFARSDNDKQYATILDVINYVRPTALIGLSAQAGAFTPEVLKRMAELNTRPIVFPLSNPAIHAECSFEQAMEHTDGRVLFASGTAFPPCKDPRTGELRIPGQGNNMYIFPGLGLGSILARPPIITDTMIYAAASALSTSLTSEEKQRNCLYPSLKRIRDVSAQVAAAVVVEAVSLGLAREAEVMQMVLADDKVHGRQGEVWDKLVALVKSKMWDTDGYGREEVPLERSKM